jgi:NPCBM/NEW2 domain-containing protein
VRTFIQRGSVTFEVDLDNVKAYDSGLMTDSTATQSITLNVANKNELKLIVTDGGNGIGSDHGNWAGARIIKPSTTPTVTPTACHQYTSTSAIPAGFGSPYDVLSSPSTNLMNVTCDTTSARVDLDLLPENWAK